LKSVIVCPSKNSVNHSNILSSCILTTESSDTASNSSTCTNSKVLSDYPVFLDKGVAAENESSNGDKDKKVLNCSVEVGASAALLPGSSLASTDCLETSSQMSPAVRRHHSKHKKHKHHKKNKRKKERKLYDSDNLEFSIKTPLV